MDERRPAPGGTGAVREQARIGARPDVDDVAAVLVPGCPDAARGPSHLGHFAHGRLGPRGIRQRHRCGLVLGVEKADLAAGLRLITGALSAAAQADAAAAYLDAADGTRAVAAAELVASIKGQPIAESPFNETARQWIARVHPSSDPSLTNLARQAVSA